MNKHVVMISVDALSNTEFDVLRDLPTFKTFIENGSYAKKVTSVYPSLTYTCHTSIITGTYPQKHGVYSNYIFDPYKTKPDWFWYSRDIQVKTLVDYVKEIGGSVGSVFWPVMGANKNITWNCPEVWSNNPKENQILVSLNAGSRYFQIKMALANLRNLKGLINKQQPQLDEFITQSAVHMIKKYKPNLSLVHLIAHDHEKHVLGAKGHHIQKLLSETDTRIARIVQATKDAGIYDQCTFVILGDHSNLTYEKIINLNAIFQDNGLLQLDELGQLKDWKAYAANCDGSAQIHVHDENDRDQVYQMLISLKDKEIGIEKVYTKNELRTIFKTDGPFEFMVEASRGYCFGKEKVFNRKYDSVTDGKLRGITYHKGHHGYSPLKENYQTIFFIKGALANQNVVVDEMHLTDIAPTISRLFGIDMMNVDGQPVECFIKSTFLQ
ncbi:alkaline phosphatase family protein [Vallitalea okinawensis]|uniref:alkaline phosphatase family protein n=1 Tax=Vallitalea okinawensis TaxID=2078660 RepID=UPI000CFB0D87|nr:ectonucleotide pyrophosphatase/phosphodiesterase [Vallitalea okinawensis]